MANDLKHRLRATLPRHLLIDLYDMAVARALAAYELIRDHTDLSGKNARAAEGQVRFRVMEKGFQDVCELHGGVALLDGVMPETGLRFFQPFMRFGDAGAGVIVSLASMPKRQEMPQKNQSRAAGVALNYYLSPRLDLDDKGPKPGDIFVSFLVARDPARAGKIEEVAIGIIDAEYQGYLFYEAIEAFLSGYADDTTPSPSPDGDGDGSSPPPLVTLKRARKIYKPPEESDTTDADKSGEDGLA